MSLDVGGGDESTENATNKTTNTDEGVVGDLQAHAVHGGDNGSLGMVTTQAAPTMYAEFLQSNVLLGYDPDIYHKSHFDDNLYRFTITGSANSDTDLYRVDDLEAWLRTGNSTHITKEADTIFGSGSTNRRVNDHVVLSDGRFAVYVTDDDADNTDVWVGDDLTSLTKQGQAFDAPDGGSIRTPDGTVHHLTEDPTDMASVIDSNAIKYYTTPENDLTNPTDHGVVIDLQGTYGWAGGDADLVNIGGTVYMFLDSKRGGEYSVAVFRTQDFQSWDLVQDQMTAVSGGDLTVSKWGGVLWGLTEQTEGSGDEIGLWRIEPTNENPLARARSRGVYWETAFETIDGFTSGTSGSGNAATLNASAGRVELSTGTTSGSKANLVKWMDPNGNRMSWQLDRVLTAYVNFVDVDEEAYIMTGGGDDGALALEHVGIAAKNGDLIGTVGDGSSETTTTLVSGASTGATLIRAELIGREKAKFYVNGAFKGEITSGLPTGKSEADRALMAFVANNGTAADKQLFINEARFAQAPDSRRS